MPLLLQEVFGMENVHDIEVGINGVEDFGIADANARATGFNPRRGDEPRRWRGADELTRYDHAARDPTVRSVLIDDVAEVHARRGGGETELINRLGKAAETKA